ncbi:glycosyltransferase family 1 protein [bacterium]|nr:glycosyltransferase family 1 protein [bacterium]
MKVVVLASFAKSLVHLRSELLVALVHAGHEVIACAPADDPSFAARVRALGVRFEEVKLDRTGTNPLRDLGYLLHVRRLLLRERPAAVFSYTAKPVIYGSLAARFAGVPKVFSMITGLGYAFASRQLKQRLMSMLLRGLYRLGLQGNSIVFFQNPDDLALFSRWGLLKAEKGVLINGSGINLEYYAEVPRITSPMVFLLVGRMLKDKGVREFLAAAGLLKQRYPQTVFRLLGPHDDHPATVPWGLIQQSIECGEVDYFPETGDIRPFMAGTSVYVLPSYREGTPRSVLEAMSMGRPVVTTDAPGCRETVVDGDNGFLVPVGNVAALAAAMERFILHPELVEQMGRRGREIAAEKYDVHKVNAVLMKAMGLSNEESI